MTMGSWSNEIVHERQERFRTHGSYPVTKSAMVTAILALRSEAGERPAAGRVLRWELLVNERRLVQTRADLKRWNLETDVRVKVRYEAAMDDVWILTAVVDDHVGVRNR